VSIWALETTRAEALRQAPIVRGTTTGVRQARAASVSPSVPLDATVGLHYDIGIVMSTDTDLVRALEAVCDLQRAWGTPRVEVASWGPTKKRLRVDGFMVWCHWLDENDYQAVRDQTSYLK
jgi:hypothetical protein